MLDVISNLKLSVGESRRIDCPVCNRQNTFSVSNEDGVLLYNCFAASCKTSGQSRSKMSAAEVHQYMRNLRKDHRDPEFVLPNYFTQSHPELGTFSDRWKIPVHELMFDVKDHRAVFLIRDGHRIVDAVGRTLRESTMKWKRYGCASRIFTSGHSQHAFVVEDAISASVIPTITPKLTGVALLGTSLLSEHIEQLSKFSSVTVALDPDARDKTVSITRQLQSSGLTALAMSLTDDIKYRRILDTQNILRTTTEDNNET